MSRDPFLKFMRNSLIVLSLSAIGLEAYMQVKFRQDPKPPRYEDINGDDILDKAVQTRYMKPTLCALVPSVSEEVFYGTGTQLNGEPLFLPKELFNQYVKK